MRLFSNLHEARRIIEEWRIDYNTNRPHLSLNELTPTEFAVCPTSGHTRTDSPHERGQVGEQVTSDTAANTRHCSTSSFGDRFAAFVAVGGAHGDRLHTRPRGVHRIFHGVVHLILYRAVFGPTTNHHMPFSVGFNSSTTVYSTVRNFPSISAFKKTYRFEGLL